VSLSRRTPLKTRTPLRKRRKGKRRELAWRSPKYLAWVRTLPCCVCGGLAEAAHHLIGVGGQGGMGTKAPDSHAMPVCSTCHRKIHETPALWPEQWEWIGRTRERARREGWELP
jgi:hypothetical protein